VLEKIFLDTVYIAALVNEEDQYHPIAANLAGQYDDHLLVTTEAVLVEVGNGMARRYKREAIAVIDELLTSKNVEVVWMTKPLFMEGLTLYKKYQDKEWGLTDCISFVVMKQKGIRLALTFDQHFKQAGFRALMRE